METTSAKSITVDTIVKASIEKVWKYWNEPEHIMQWNQADPSWHCPKATNDLRIAGKFNYTMAAKDGSMSFDFEGIYSDVQEQSVIAYGLADGRKVKVTFSANGDTTQVIETFDLETENSEELQRGGWQAILNSFKQHTESH